MTQLHNPWLMFSLSSDDWPTFYGCEQVVSLHHQQRQYVIFSPLENKYTGRKNGSKQQESDVKKVAMCTISYSNPGQLFCNKKWPGIIFYWATITIAKKVDSIPNWDHNGIIYCGIYKPLFINRLSDSLTPPIPSYFYWHLQRQNCMKCWIFFLSDTNSNMHRCVFEFT